MVDQKSVWVIGVMLLPKSKCKSKRDYINRNKNYYGIGMQTVLGKTDNIR